MKAFLFVSMIALSLSSTFASARETTLEDVSSIQPIENKWSTDFYMQGGRTDSGFALGLESPTWNSFGVRLIYSFDHLDDRATSFSFNTLEAALKLQLVRGSSMGIVPYLLYGVNSFTPVKSETETGGSKSGTEFGLGIEWRYKLMGIVNDNTVSGAVFAELMQESSTFANAPTVSGGIVMHDGALSRLGLRAFF